MLCNILCRMHEVAPNDGVTSVCSDAQVEIDTEVVARSSVVYLQGVLVEINILDLVQEVYVNVVDQARFF